MNTTTNLPKDHRVGLWCKRAAWIILALGILQTALLFYYHSQFSLPGEPALLLASVLANLSSFIFYFFILYAAGTLVDWVTLRFWQNRQQTPPGPW